MILVDTSIWIDHLRSGDETIAALLHAGRVLAHPFVIGEIALGNLRRRETILVSMQGLPQAVVATDREVLQFIDQCGLAGLGIGFVDAHLLASARLTVGSSLWTRDKRLMSVADRLDVAARFDN